MRTLTAADLLGTTPAQVLRNVDYLIETKRYHHRYEALGYLARNAYQTVLDHSGNSLAALDIEMDILSAGAQLGLCSPYDD